MIPVECRLIPRLAAAMALAILAAGCTVPDRSSPLADTPWALTEIRDDTGHMVPVLAGTNVTAVFSADGRITGSAGCNRYFAGYSLSGNQIAISDTGSTKMFCHDPEGVMVQESRFLGHLTASTGYRIAGVTLTLLGGDDRPLLVFRQET